jgi:glycosyltransferase involved in cell wall biosynthesis
MARSKNILVVTHWCYEEGLIQSYTLPYLRIIHKMLPASRIFLITHEKNGLEKNKEKLARIADDLRQDNITLAPEKYHRAGIMKYLSVGISLLRHIWLIASKRIGYVHSFCTPAGSYAWFLSKFTNSTLIIDSYEPHSEYMRDSGTWSEKSFAYRFLRLMEKKQAQSAKHIIATTPGMLPFTESRFDITLKNGFVKPACVNLEKFHYKQIEAENIRSELGLKHKIIGLYAGKFGDFYLDTEIFDFFQSAFEFWKDSLHVLFLSDLKEEQLQQFCAQHQLSRNNFTLVSIPHQLMPSYLSVADFAISPYRPAPSKRFCTPIKNGEYWAVGLPIIITKDISVDSDIIDENGIGYVLRDLSTREYRNAVQKIDSLIKNNRDELRRKIRQIAVEKRSFDIADKIYSKIYR